MKRNLKRSKALAGVCFLGLAFLFGKPVSAEDPRYPKITLLGITGGYSQYQTEWEAITLTGGATHLPLHRHFKYQAGIMLERRSLAQMGATHLDFRGDIVFGVLGRAEQGYLPPSYEKEISDGGLNAGGNLEFKMAYPLGLSARTHIALFLGGGVGFHMLQSTGKELGPRFDDFSYESGWTETLVQIPVSLGISFDFESFSLIPQLRYTPVALAGTDWQPTAIKPKSKSATTISGMLSIGFKRRQ